MTNYYLRVEGVNLANFVYDTNDLSTIRGGGQLLLEAINRIFDWIENDPDIGKLAGSFQLITKGASWGLIRFATPTDKDADSVVDKIRRYLAEDAEYQHATFTIVALPENAGAKYPQTRDMLTTLSRFQQMTAPSVAVPTKAEKPVTLRRNGLSQKHFACQVDKIRPATLNETVKGGVQRAVSASVKRRRLHGRDSKRRQWYEKRTHISDLPKFVNDFKELAEGPDSVYGNLNRKMAVIYLDGNGFGKMQRAYCTSADKQEKFDRLLREECQDGVLTQILTKILTQIPHNSHWLAAPNSEGEKHLRLETLLWGGDEIIWVAPAWQGWRLLADFFRFSKAWEEKMKQPVTHGAGLVFCHHNAPIKQITDLAHRLGDLAKNNSRTANRVAYQVLESFDHAGMNVEKMREARCPRPVSPQELIINGDTMTEIIEPVKILKKHLPKRQVHRLVRHLYDVELEKVESLQDDFAKIPQLKQGGIIDRLTSCFGVCYGRWLHLLELWDYIGAVDSTEEGKNVTD